MWTKTIGKLVALQQNVLVYIQKLAEEMKLPEEILVWLLEPKGQQALKEACGAALLHLKQNFEGLEELLEFVGVVTTPATTGKFVAKEKFVRDTGHKAKVKISSLGDNFTAWFLNGDGKTEDPISEQTLRYHKLREYSVDGPIIEELGGEAKAETTLSEMFSLMEKQKHGEDGVLLNNSYTNIFYIRDSAGVLRAVCVGWGGDGWSVGVFSVGHPDGWDDGGQVFSRNFVLESSEPLV